MSTLRMMIGKGTTLCQDFVQKKEPHQQISHTRINTLKVKNFNSI